MSLWNKLIKRLCENEGLKSQIKVGDMRELLKDIVESEENVSDIIKLHQMYILKPKKKK